MCIFIMFSIIAKYVLFQLVVDSIVDIRLTCTKCAPHFTIAY